MQRGGEVAVEFPMLTRKLHALSQTVASARERSLTYVSGCEVLEVVSDGGSDGHADQRLEVWMVSHRVEVAFVVDVDTKLRLQLQGVGQSIHTRLNLAVEC